MKITILQEKLKEGIKTVERVSQKTLTLPILQNISISAEKNFLNLKTTNLEIGINWWGLAKVEKEGEILVPTRILSDLVSFLPAKPITLEVKGLNLSLQCGDYQTDLRGLSGSEFPIIPQLKEGEQISVDSKVFCQALSQVVNVASPSVTRPEISGIFFLFQKDLIKMVATDSFRLAEKKLFLKSPLLKEYSLILPQQTTREIINIFSEKTGDIQIYFSANQVLFECIMPELSHPQVQLTSKLIDGEYPDYEAIIPKKYETQAVLPRNELLNQIKTASIFSGKINEVRLKIDPKEKKVYLSSQNPDLGEYKSFLVGKINGKENQISFNHRFLADGISEIKTPEVVFEISNEENPAIFKPAPPADEGYLYVVMPIKAS